MLKEFEGKRPFLDDPVFIAESADLIGEVELGKDSSIWYGAVLRGDVARIRIGPSTNIQDGAVIHVDSGIPCDVGEGVTVGHGAILHACQIGDHVLVGMGAIVLDGARIERESIVAAGALVTPGKSFPPRSMIMGSPARRVREITDEEVEAIRSNSIAYALRARKAATSSRS